MKESEPRFCMGRRQNVRKGLQEDLQYHRKYREPQGADYAVFARYLSSTAMFSWKTQLYLSCHNLSHIIAHTMVSFHHIYTSDPIRPLFPKTSQSFTLGNSIRQPLGGIHDPDALVLPGRLVDPGDQQFGIRIADPQQRVDLPPEGVRG